MTIRTHDILGLAMSDVNDVFRWRYQHFRGDFGYIQVPRDREIEHMLDQLRAHPWIEGNRHGRSMYMVTDGDAIGAICYTRVDWYDTASFWSNPACTGVGRRLLRVIHDRVLRYGELHIHVPPTQVKALHQLRTFPYAIEEKTNASGMPIVRFRVVGERTDYLPFMQVTSGMVTSPND